MPFPATGDVQVPTSGLIFVAVYVSVIMIPVSVVALALSMPEVEHRWLVAIAISVGLYAAGAAFASAREASPPAKIVAMSTSAALGATALGVVLVNAIDHPFKPWLLAAIGCPVAGQIAVSRVAHARRARRTAV